MLQNQRAYGLGAPLLTQAPVPYAINGVPFRTNVPFGQLIQNETSGNWYINNGGGSYSLISSSGGSILSIAGNAGTATPAAGVITINGGTTGLTTSASGSTVSLTGTLGVANGGTGVATLTGLPLFAGTAAATAVSYTAVTAWVPNLQINGSSTGITYTTQSGFYQRIGSMIFFNCVITLSSKGASNGNVTISNLPVAVGTSGALNHLNVQFDVVSLTADYTGIDAAPTASTTVLNFTQYGSGESLANLTDTQLANTSSLFMSGVYFVN